MKENRNCQSCQHCFGDQKTASKRCDIWEDCGFSEKYCNETEIHWGCDYWRQRRDNCGGRVFSELVLPASQYKRSGIEPMLSA